MVILLEILLVTSCIWYLFTHTLVLHVHTWYLFIHMLVALGAHSVRYVRPSCTWEIPPRVAWSLVATATLQVLQIQV